MELVATTFGSMAIDCILKGEHGQMTAINHGSFTLQPIPDPKPRTMPLSASRIPRAPLRVQTMPVAKLPPAYVDAVMRGAHARLNALKAEAGSAERR